MWMGHTLRGKTIPIMCVWVVVEGWGAKAELITRRRPFMWQNIHARAATGLSKTCTHGRLWGGGGVGSASGIDHAEAHIYAAETVTHVWLWGSAKPARVGGSGGGGVRGAQFSLAGTAAGRQRSDCASNMQPNPYSERAHACTHTYLWLPLIVGSWLHT